LILNVTEKLSKRWRQDQRFKMASSKRRVKQMISRIRTDNRRREDQYALLKNLTPQISKAFVAFQNQKAAVYFNEAFGK